MRRAAIASPPAAKSLPRVAAPGGRACDPGVQCSEGSQRTHAA